MQTLNLWIVRNFRRKLCSKCTFEWDTILYSTLLYKIGFWAGCLKLIYCLAEYEATHIKRKTGVKLSCAEGWFSTVCLQSWNTFDSSLLLLPPLLLLAAHRLCGAAAALLLLVPFLQIYPIKVLKKCLLSKQPPFSAPSSGSTSPSPGLGRRARCRRWRRWWGKNEWEKNRRKFQSSWNLVWAPNNTNIFWHMLQVYGKNLCVSLYVLTDVKCLQMTVPHLTPIIWGQNRQILCSFSIYNCTFTVCLV